jgi:hypothetical protein
LRCSAGTLELAFEVPRSNNGFQTCRRTSFSSVEFSREERSWYSRSQLLSIMLEEQAFVGASISRFRFPAALLVLINSSATNTDSLGFTLHLRFNRASKPPRNQPRPASLTSTQLLLSAYNNQIILPSVYNPSHQPEITMKHFAMLAFVLAALFGTGRAKIYPLVSCIY